MNKRDLKEYIDYEGDLIFDYEEMIKILEQQEEAEEPEVYERGYN